jgi:two-component system NarL family sensor kinase
MESVAGQEVSFLIGAGILIMLSMALALIAFYGRAQRKLLAQRLEAQELILQKTIMTQEEERNRIAKELHDDIGSKLNVAFLHIQRLKKATEASESQRASVAEINDILNTSIASTRRLSHELLPPTLQKFGLAEALEELCEGYEKTGYVRFDLKLDGLEQAIQDDMQSLNLFRILQELSKNSIKHGEARQVMIHFLEDEKGKHFRYKDDGKGVEKEKLMQGKGLGMGNVESRLKMIGGSWVYDSAPGQGMKAEITFS